MSGWPTVPPAGVLQPPTLDTARLRLRPFVLADAPEVRRLAGAREVYETTALIPHPYGEGVAERWIATHLTEFYERRGVNLAITRRTDGALLGSVSLTLVAEDRRAELGYWVGLPYWNQGYATEAAAGLVRHGFERLGLHKVTSRHHENNPASGRVMEKIGMVREGRLTDEVWKDGAPRSLIVYGLLRRDWAEAQERGA